VIFPDDIFDLASLARGVAKRSPERVAVIEPGKRNDDGTWNYKRHTWAELSADTESVAVGLREMGIAERTRTVFMAPPSHEACVLYLALNRVGATVLMIDPSVGLRNVGERLRRVRPEVFVGIPTAHVARVIYGWGPRFVDKAIVVGEGAFFPGARTLRSLRRTAPLEPQRAEIGPDDPMTVLYTTGSTGPAKPALYTHRNFCGVFRIVHESWGFEGSEESAVDMPVFPAFFMVGLSAGGTVVVPPIRFSREPPAATNSGALIEVINECGVRSLFGSPVLLENMAAYAERHGLQTPSLRRVIGGGAPITGPAMKRLGAMMPNGEVFANYGATEALPTSAHSARETNDETWAKTVAGAGICVGRPFTGVEICIAAIQDGAADEFEALPTGEIGEILVRSPHISVGYLDDPESTRRNKIGSWHRIGDAGTLDESGRLWVVGRVSQRVRGADGPLFSLLCEPIFDAHPGVKRSGLVGVPAGEFETPIICVEHEPGVDPDALRGELLATAAQHAVTRGVSEVLFIDSLPVDPRHNSKIERPTLTHWAARELARRA
jgi:acyl-CoA synthetase (AMP-forming)/AMP-acid ligase II